MNQRGVCILSYELLTSGTHVQTTCSECQLVCTLWHNSLVTAILNLNKGADLNKCYHFGYLIFIVA